MQMRRFVMTTEGSYDLSVLWQPDAQERQDLSGVRYQADGPAVNHADAEQILLWRQELRQRSIARGTDSGISQPIPVRRSASKRLGLSDNPCPVCDYPLRKGATVCPACA